MNVLIYVLLVPVSVFFAARWFDRCYEVHGSPWLLGLACAIFATSTFYPSPLIDGNRTQFVTHLVGGGVFVGLLWVYFMPLMRKLSWWYKAMILYAGVSALGVLNELYELWAHENGIIKVPITDTSWDLLANTLGALTVFVVYYAMKRLFKQR
ncbi:MAG: hypothetical protein WBB39_01590 [Candidatus Saccharimonadales bacterium]